MLHKYFHIIILSLAIILLNLWPSFFTISGTYFLLDTGFAPFTEFKWVFETSFYWYLMDFGAFLFGYTLWSKLYFLWVLCTGIYLGILIARYIGSVFPQYQRRLLDTVSIIVAVYNPFFYERIISQTGIALGVYLIGIGMVLLLFPKKNFILAGLCFALSWMIFPHAILLISLVLIVLWLFHIRDFFIYVLVFLIVWLLNANWIIWDFILWVNQWVSKVQSFDRANIEVFQGNSLSGLWVDVTHLLGYGFWGERYHITSPDDIIPYWYIFGGFVLVLVVYGLYRLFQQRPRNTLCLSIIAIVSYILALGIASPLWGWFNSLLYEYIPFYIGMREPQKWLWLTQIVYMIGLSLALVSLISQAKKYKIISYISYSLLFLPLAWTPASLIGYWGQLNISDYPNDVFIARDFIQNTLPWEKNILNLPWHSYMSCDWMYGKITSNRAKDIYYPAHIISADNIEIAHLYTNSDNPLSADIDNFIRTQDRGLLEKNNISYILFSATCGDRQNYSYLDESPEIYEKILDTTHVDIYKINYEK